MWQNALSSCWMWIMTPTSDHEVNYRKQLSIFAPNWQRCLSEHSASVLGEMKTLPGQSGFIQNVCYNCFLGDEMNATLCDKMNLLSYASTLENVNGQHKPPGMLTPSEQFRKASKVGAVQNYSTCEGKSGRPPLRWRHSENYLAKIYINGDALISLYHCPHSFKQLHLIKYLMNKAVIH